MAEALLNALSSAPTVAPELHRSIRIENPITSVPEELSVGKTLTLLPQSFSASIDQANRFGGAGYHDIQTVLLRCAPGSSALHIAPLGQEAFWKEQEWILSGRFEITGVERTPSCITVDIAQREGIQALEGEGKPPMTVKEMFTRPVR